MGVLKENPCLLLLGLLSAICPVSALVAKTTSNGDTAYTDANVHHFDYVIVGGGVAGLVLASRLSETPTITVAVIEAGTWLEDNVGNSTTVPGYAGRFNGLTPQVDWGFHTTPQAAMSNQSFAYYRAKGLGGCSAINYMAYGHTSIGAHKLWADTLKDQSYTYTNMLPHYHKTMDFEAPNLQTRFANATPDYNLSNTVTSGQLSVTYASYAQPWSTWVAKGLESVGIARVSAYINGNLFGQTWQLNTITKSNCQRSDSATAYLRPVTGRKNLRVFYKTFVERVVFKGTTATGVQVSNSADSTFTIKANKEVILSAGVFQSPQLLQVSGIGPKAELQKLGITVVADRPGVGRGMIDHITVPMSYQVNVNTLSAFGNSTYTANSVSQWNNQGVGPLCSAGGDYHGMEKIPASLRQGFSNSTLNALAALPSDWPEAAYAVYPSNVYPTTTPGANYGSMLGTLIAPQSRGSVTINSSSMRDAPLINGNYLSNPSDVEVLIAIFKRLRAVLTSQDIAPALIGQEIAPGPSVQTDAQILAYIKKLGNPLFHAFASNKMGVASDPNAVVDNKCRVFGVKKLRVVDSSSFPFLPPGPAPQIQVYTLAEKIAADIKAGL